MRWRWWRKLDDDTSGLPTVNPDEAAEELQKSLLRKDEQTARWTEVNSVTRGLAAQHRANHLGEMINDSMRRKQS